MQFSLAYVYGYGMGSLASCKYESRRTDRQSMPESGARRDDLYLQQSIADHSKQFFAEIVASEPKGQSSSSTLVAPIIIDDELQM